MNRDLTRCPVGLQGLEQRVLSFDGVAPPRDQARSFAWSEVVSQITEDRQLLAA